MAVAEPVICACGCRPLRRWIASVLLVIGGALLLADGAAADDTAVEIALGVDVTGFRYREFADDGRELNRERGELPGIRLIVQADDGIVLARLDSSLHAGSVDYRGETRAGRSARTRTDTRLITLAAEVGPWLDAEHNWNGFARLAHRNWVRDIQSTSTARGIHEEYRWYEVGVGLRRIWRVAGTAGWRHEVAAMLFRTTGGTVFVEESSVSSARDDMTLDLGSEPGARLRYTATGGVGGWTLRIEPYLEYWEFGRSDDEVIRSNGSPTGLTMHEPRSESWRLGLSLATVF